MSDCSPHKILPRVNAPGDIRHLTGEELSLLAEEIRDFLCAAVLKNGGHLASNLGVVELTLALHRVFDFSKDHLIFDVGHQCYTHKLLTGRKALFDTLRQRGGLSGFTRRSESEFDCFGAGHSSTSVSAAIGFAEADRINGRENYTVAVLGDGAFTGGMIHEALNNCRPDLRLIIVLNENEMSISENIGAFAALINKLRLSEGYYRSKRRTRLFIIRIPLIGKKLFRLIRRIKKYFKNKLYKSNYFEDLGLYYLGPADGNDREQTERLLREARAAGQSTVVHLRTQKGKGYPPAEQDPGKYHGVSPVGTEKCRNFSAEASEFLSTLAEKDERICAVTAAMADGTGLSAFAGRFPARFFDVGIAEEHALTFSAGLAADGMKPYFAVYSSFLQRGYDNLIHDIALQRLPVTVLIDRAGLNTGDGATHHGIFDVSFLSGIPGMTLLTPSCFVSLREAITASAAAEGPVAIRYPNAGDREDIPSRYPFGSSLCRCDFAPGDTPEAVIITYGKILSEAERAKASLPSCGILLLEKLMPYAGTAKEILSLLPSSVKKVVFLEEGIKNGGAGMILREYLPSALSYTHLAIDGIFEAPAVSGSLYRDYGIGAENILAALQKD